MMLVVLSLSVIRFSLHFPSPHHVTQLLIHYPNYFWLTVPCRTWLPDANHWPQTPMPDPYLTPMTQTQFPYLLTKYLGLRAPPQPSASVTY